MKNFKKNKKIILGYLFALGATAIWSGNFIIARDINENIPPISLAFWRWFVAVFTLLPFGLKHLIAERHTLIKNWLYISITAFLGITVFNTLIYIAAHTTTAINLSLISITFPIFIIIFSRIFFRELVTLKKGVGILIVLIGVALLITKGNLSKLLNLSFSIGDVWMLVAAIIFAFYSILLKQKPKNLSVLGFQLSTFILGLVFIFPFFILETIKVSTVNFETKTIFSILYVGIFASLVAYILWDKAIQKIGPANAGIIYYTLPLFSGFLAYLFLKESMEMLHFYSLLLILFGIFISNYNSKKIKLK